MAEHCIGWHSLAPEAGANGVTRRRIKAVATELVRVEIHAGVAAPAHSHPHELLAEVLKGSGTLATPDGARSFEAGDVFHFPAETEHAASFDNDTLFLEINLP